MGVRVNLIGAQRKTDRIVRGMATVTAELARQHMREFNREMTAIAPRDTHRYVAAWQGAAKQIGAAEFVEPLRPSAFRALQMDRLDRQIVQLENLIDRTRKGAQELRRLYDLWFTSRGRKITAAGRRMLRQSAKMEADAEQMQERLARAELQYELLAANESAIVIWGRMGRSARVRPDGTKTRRRKGTLHTVRAKIYGGRGTMMPVGSTSTVATLENLEAHARLVGRTGKVRRPLITLASRVAMQKTQTSERGYRRLSGRALAALQKAAKS